MRILIVEDDSDKRGFVEYYLKYLNVDVHSVRSTKPAILYATQNSHELDGIILDSGLTSHDFSDDYDFKKGLEVIEELATKGIKIPILINSSTYLNLPEIQKKHDNVVEQMYIEDDDYMLRWFINFLEKRKQ